MITGIIKGITTDIITSIIAGGDTLSDAAITSRNPALWGNSEDIITSGGNVTQINDKGSLGHNLTPVAGAMTLSSINGVPAVDYGTGASNRMGYSGLIPISNISDAGAITIFIVQEIKVSGRSRNWALSWDATSSTQLILVGSPDTVFSGGKELRVSYGTINLIGDSLRATVSDIDTTPKVLAFVKRGDDTGALYVNGTLVLDSVMDGIIDPSLGQFAIGGIYLDNPAGQFKGLIAEYIVFPEALDITAINEINDYLKPKYSII